MSQEGVGSSGADLVEKPPSGRRSRTAYIIGGIVALIIVVLAVVLPVYFVVIRPKQLSVNNNGGGTGVPAGGSTGGPTTASPTTSAGPSEPSGSPITGGDGSVITMADGTQFTYKNPFGGYWVWDEADPFNNGARAQLTTPALNETWDWAVNKVYGVNLGGWLTIEPFITPALFQKYPGTVDEWTLSIAMASDPASGGLEQIRQHYETFITEKDFADIAAAGLNWVRISLPYWSIEKTASEPFLEKVSWEYFLKAIQWARKYGIRINLDLHTLPGSQNGWNHSGKLGTTNMLNGTMGLANAQRSLNYIRTITQFISQPQYKDVIPLFGVINEPNGINAISMTTLGSMYLEIYDMIRGITGEGAGNGPYISIHDSFSGITRWTNFLPGADRMAIDNHNYFCFDSQLQAGDIADFIPRVCGLADRYTASLAGFGVTTIGEWSNAINDCGLFVNNVGNVGTRYEGNWIGGATPRLGSCAPWVDYTTWPTARKTALKQYMLTSMEVYEHAFFWTWKIGPSSVSGRVEAPFWSYQLAIQEGWAPDDPRDSVGACAQAINVPANTFQGAFQPWQVGAGGGGISDNDRLQYPWPPLTFTNIPNVAVLPTYTPTGVPVTLTGPTFTKPGTAETFDAGSGWFNPADTAGYYVPVAGCQYPDTWNPGDAIPAPCPALRRRDPRPVAQPAPTAL